MILKSFLLGPHLKNGFDRLSQHLKALRPFGEGELRLPLRCFFLQNYFSSDEDTGIMKKSSISKASLNVPHWKLTWFIPFPHFHFFSFLRSQKNWAHKLKCPFSCHNFHSHIYRTELWGSETLTTSQRSYFHPDELLISNFFNILNPNWLFFNFRDKGCPFLS